MVAQVEIQSENYKYLIRCFMRHQTSVRVVGVTGQEGPGEARRLTDEGAEQRPSTSRLRARRSGNTETGRWKVRGPQHQRSRKRHSSVRRTGRLVL